MLRRKLIPTLVWLIIAATGCGSEPSAAEYLERARAYETAGKFNEAAIETRNAVKKDSENKDARILLGMLQLRFGDPAGAEKELMKARQLGAEPAEILPSMARALLQQGKLDELQRVDGTGLPSEGEASVLASRAYAHLADEDPETARADADRALELDPASTGAQIVLARLDAAAGDLSGATTRVRDMLDVTPENAEGWELLGDLARVGRNPDLAVAIASYDRAIEHGVGVYDLRLKRAQLQLELGDDAAALNDLDVLSKAGIEVPALEFTRGQIELRKRELPAAQIRFEKALTLTPDYPPALGGLALTHLALGNVGQAEQYGKQMMAATEDSDAARRLLAAIRLESGRYDLAAETIEPNVRSSGNVDPFSVRVMSTALLKLGRYDEAIEQMAVLPQNLPPEGADDSASSLVLARAPSRELLDDFIGGDAAMERDPGDDFLDEKERRIAYVLELIGRNENDRALEEAETLRVSMPDSAVPHNLIGRVHLAGGRTDAARTAFEQALKVEPENVSAERFLAELDLQAGDVDAARKRLEKALLGDGDSENVLLALARVEAQAGDEPAMLEWLAQARVKHSGSAAPILLLAQYRASRAEHELVLKELANLEESQRQQPLALQLEGLSLIALRRFDEALERFDALITLQPDTATWQYLRAQAEAGLNNEEATIHDLKKALEMSPEHVPSLLALANVEMLSGNFEAAEVHIDLLRNLIPGRSELNAVVARLAERKAAATTDSANDVPAKQLRIDSTETALSTARDLWNKGNRNDAVALLDAWLEGNPGDLAVRLTLANSYANLERIDDAISEYETLLEGDVASLGNEARQSALNNLAWYLREKDPMRAVDYAKQALEVSPESTDTLDTLAMILFGQGDNAAAKEAFDRASAIGFDNPTIVYHGAQIEAALGNDGAARALLEPLVDEAVDFPEAKEAARLLDEIGRSGG